MLSLVNFRKGIAKWYYKRFLPKRKEALCILLKRDTEISLESFNFSEKFPQKPVLFPFYYQKNTPFCGVISKRVRDHLYGHMTIIYNLITLKQARLVNLHRICSKNVIFFPFCWIFFEKSVVFYISDIIFEGFVN